MGESWISIGLVLNLAESPPHFFDQNEEGKGNTHQQTSTYANHPKAPLEFH
jgi:hypothetical protein